MPDIDKLLGMLQSPDANKRYDACEELRVALTLPPAAIAALQTAQNDADPSVREAVARALQMHPAPSPPHPLPQAPRPETKTCPYCAETIKYEAVMCRHCGKDQRRLRPTMGQAASVALSVGLAFAFVVGLMEIASFAEVADLVQDRRLPPLALQAQLSQALGATLSSFLCWTAILFPLSFLGLWALNKLLSPKASSVATIVSAVIVAIVLLLALTLFIAI